jgi:AbrB family looped-hinge helix DNA binding protein
MKRMIVPIDQAGRVVLPKNVRQELAIKPGDTLLVAISGSSVMLTPKKESSGFVRKGKALVFTNSGDDLLANDDVGRILEQSREREDPGSLFPAERKRRE